MLYRRKQSLSTRMTCKGAEGSRSCRCHCRRHHNTVQSVRRWLMARSMRPESEVMDLVRCLGDLEATFAHSSVRLHLHLPPPPLLTLHLCGRSCLVILLRSCDPEHEHTHPSRPVVASRRRHHEDISLYGPNSTSWPDCCIPKDRSLHQRI